MKKTLQLALVVLLLAGGCLPATKQAPEPVIPTQATLADACEKFVRQYADGLAAASAETAAKATAGEFADVTAADEFCAIASRTAREKANEGLVEAMNKSLTDEKKKAGSTTAPMFEEMALGFSRINRKRK